MAMVTVKTDSDIQNLISCPKHFRSAPKKEYKSNNNVMQKFTVYNQENGLDFTVFIAYLAQMEQDFSIGLMYDNMLLFRCNGFHGTTRAGFYSAGHHAYPHSHTLSIEDIKCGRSKKPSNITNLTGKYVNLNTAILYFFDTCGIIGYDKYFEHLEQVTVDDILQTGRD